ncbi:MAG: hypothetical protein KA160_03105 [Lacibacter sp.]|nr:hypothetical protein [Lacibacter sp.]
MEFLETIARLSLLLPCFLFFLRKTSQTRENWVVFLFVVFTILQQAVVIFSAKTNNLQIADLISFFNPLTYLIFIYFFFRYTLIEPVNRKITLVCTIAYIALQLIPFLFETASSITSIITTVNTVFILLFCLLYFFEQIRFPKTMFVYTQSSFWSIVGFLVFSAGTFFIFWYNTVIKQSEVFENQYIIIHALIFITRNLLFSIALVIKPDKQPLTENHFSLT